MTALSMLAKNYNQIYVVFTHPFTVKFGNSTNSSPISYALYIYHSPVKLSHNEDSKILWNLTKQGGTCL